MTEARAIRLPLDRDVLPTLGAGDRVLLDGDVFAARDAAHERLHRALLAGEDLPIALRDACIYYVGPSPAPPGRVVGAAGPTTASRVDAFTPPLLAEGLGAMIGKGRRSPAVRDAIVRHGAIYFVATGGIGALLARCIESYEVIAYPELGTEALARMRLRAFPALVGIDCRGRDLYDEGPRPNARPDLLQPGA